MKNEKRKIKVMYFCIIVSSLMIISSTGYSNTISSKVNDDLLIFEKPVGISGEKVIKTDANFYKIQKEYITLSDETQITSSEFDESHPSVDIDYNGNPFLMYQSYEEFGVSKIYFQKSSDGGTYWPDDSIWVSEIGELAPIKPDVDFTDGIRAFATPEFEAQDPLLYFYDFVDIDDDQTWELYYFDRSGYSSYISETDVAANKSGSVALGSILDYEGDEYFEDTLLITWDADNFADGTADGGVYWRNTDSDGTSIPRSHLCGDAGDKIFFCFESKEIDRPASIYSAYCKVDENTLYTDWDSSVVARSPSYNCTYPDISVSGKTAYCVYMSDINGNQDIYVAVTSSGTLWKKYKVADTLDDEMYPVISANGEKATCLFIKNGDLYKTSTEDEGKTWSTPIKINTESNTVVEEYQNIDIKGSYGFWTDNRDFNDDIYFDIVGLEPILTIDEIKGGVGVTVSLSNIGNAPAEEELWTIDILGLLLIGSHSEGTISIPVQSTKTVKSKFIFGFGKVTIIATFSEVTKTATGFAFGPLILAVK